MTSRARRGTAHRPAAFRSISSQLSAGAEQAVRDGADAELRGDWATALACHRSVPFFTRSTHGCRLALLDDLDRPDGGAPDWLLGRWLTVLCRRRLWTGGAEDDLHSVLRMVVPILYPDGIPFESIGCPHPEQVLAWIGALDWVVRQVDVYERGALRQLLDGPLSPDVAARAGDVRTWATAPLRAYRFDGPTPDGRLALTDLTDDRALDVADLGLADPSLGIAEGRCLLGRIVPSASVGTLFEWRPLPVADRVAREVARDPSRWLSALQRAVLGGRLESTFSQLTESSLIADQPHRAWLCLAGVPLTHIDGTDPRGLVGGALDVVLDLAGQGSDFVGPRRQLVADLLLDVTCTSEVLAGRASWHRLPSWRVLAEIMDAAPAGTVPSSVATLCHELVMWCDAAPA